MLFLAKVDYQLFAPSSEKKWVIFKYQEGRQKKTYVFVLNKDFFKDFCKVKNNGG